MSDRVEAARRALAAHGLDADAIVAGTVTAETVAPHLHAPHAAVVLDALGDLPSPATAGLLAALEPTAPDSTTRRAVRRALFRLKQRGVAAPAAVATPAARPRTYLEGFLTAFDGRGDRIAWLVHTPPGGATTLVIAVFNEPAGLRDIRLTTIARKQLRDARERFLRDQGIALVPVDGDVLDALLVEAHERLATRERSQDYLRIRRDLTKAPPLTPVEPRPRGIALPAPEAVAGALARSAELLAEPEIAQWWPTPEQLQPYVQELRALRDSPIVVAPGQDEQRLRRIVDAAARDVFPPVVLSRRLAGSAYVFAETGRPEAAALALAVAEVLRTAPETADVPLAGALLHRALGTVLASQADEQAAERQDALVLTPGEALRARSPSRPPHTRE